MEKSQYDKSRIGRVSEGEGKENEGVKGNKILRLCDKE